MFSIECTKAIRIIPFIQKTITYLLPFVRISRNLNILHIIKTEILLMLNNNNYYIYQRCQPGRNFRPGPQKFFFGPARPGPARNQCIIKCLLYNIFEILQQNQYNYIKLHSHFRSFKYSYNCNVLYNLQLYQQRLKNLGIGQNFIHEFHSNPVLQWHRQNFGQGGHSA